jgi:hypothetical protein
MYNKTTRSYTCADAAGSLEWIIEGVEADPKITEADAQEWANQVIDNTIEQDLIALEENAPAPGSFPLMSSYNTNHFYQSLDEYMKEKTEEIKEDLESEREEIVALILSMKKTDNKWYDAELRTMEDGTYYAAILANGSDDDIQEPAEKFAEIIEKPDVVYWLVDGQWTGAETFDSVLKELEDLEAERQDRHCGKCSRVH